MSTIPMSVTDHASFTDTHEAAAQRPRLSPGDSDSHRFANSPTRDMRQTAEVLRQDEPSFGKAALSRNEAIGVHAPRVGSRPAREVDDHGLVLVPEERPQASPRTLHTAEAAGADVRHEDPTTAATAAAKVRAIDSAPADLGPKSTAAKDTDHRAIARTPSTGLLDVIRQFYNVVLALLRWIASKVGAAPQAVQQSADAHRLREGTLASGPSPTVKSTQTMQDEHRMRHAHRTADSDHPATPRDDKVPIHQVTESSAQPYRQIQAVLNALEALLAADVQDRTATGEGRTALLQQTRQIVQKTLEELIARRERTGEELQGLIGQESTSDQERDMIQSLRSGWPVRTDSAVVRAAIPLLEQLNETKSALACLRTINETLTRRLDRLEDNQIHPAATGPSHASSSPRNDQLAAHFNGSTQENAGRGSKPCADSTTDSTTDNNTDSLFATLRSNMRLPTRPSNTASAPSPAQSVDEHDCELAVHERMR